MFKNSCFVPVQYKDDKKFDEAKFKQVMEDTQLINEFRRFLMITNYCGDLTLKEF